MYCLTTSDVKCVKTAENKSRGRKGERKQQAHFTHRVGRKGTLCRKFAEGGGETTTNNRETYKWGRGDTNLNFGRKICDKREKGTAVREAEGGRAFLLSYGRLDPFAFGARNIR